MQRLAWLCRGKPQMLALELGEELPEELICQCSDKLHVLGKGAALVQCISRKQGRCKAQVSLPSPKMERGILGISENGGRPFQWQYGTVGRAQVIQSGDSFFLLPDGSWMTR